MVLEAWKPRRLPMVGMKRRFKNDTMEIKLQRVGGLLPVVKECALRVDWSEEELKKLLKKIHVTKKPNSQSRDMTSYYLEVDGKAVPVDLAKVPSQYKDTFNDLTENLKIVKI